MWADSPEAINSVWAPAPAGVREILFLTGTRADFGKMKSLMREVDNAPDFMLTVFATGMHMLSRYGTTVLEIQKAGFDRIYTYINQHEEMRMETVFANTVLGLGNFVAERRPDLIVVHGDRIEALAGAIVGVLQNVHVAHVEGGEVSGSVDELIRHSISKLAHIHFVSNERAQRRLIQMGEIEESVQVIGNPSIDRMLSDELPSLEMVRSYYEIPFSDYAIFVYHPVTTEVAQIEKNVAEVVPALLESEMNFVVIEPNNDLGSAAIRRAIGPLRGHPRFRICSSMRFEYYLTLLRNARAIVGNSSSGIQEAPVYGVPTLNVGSRQQNRSAGSAVFHVHEERTAILQALRNLPSRVTPEHEFGSGNSAPLFIQRLRDPHLWAIDRQKQFRDLS